MLNDFVAENEFEPEGEWCNSPDVSKVPKLARGR